MKTKIDIEEARRTIDFAALSSQLRELVAKGETGHKPTLGLLLDPVKDALNDARDRGMTIPAIAGLLKRNGLPMSVTTLRQYLNRQPGHKRKVTRRRRKSDRRHETNAARPPATPVDLPSNPQPSLPTPNRRPANPAPGIRSLRGKF